MAKVQSLREQTSETRRSIGSLLAALGLGILLPGAAALLTAHLLTASVAAQGSCPPGTGFDDAHPPVGVGFVCVPGAPQAFVQQVVTFVPGAYPDPPNCPTSTGWPPGIIAKNQNGTASGVLGPPEVTDPTQFGAERVNLDTSLGIGGELIVRFGIPLTGSGNSDPDIWVWEVGPAIEPHNVYVGTSPTGPWSLVGQATSAFNGSEGFDIDDDGFGRNSSFFYVRILDTQTISPATFVNCTAGSDIDAIAVLSDPPPPVPTAPTWAIALLAGSLLLLGARALRHRSPPQSPA